MTKFIDSFLTSILVSILLVCVLLFFKLQFFYAFIGGLLVLGFGFYRSAKRSSLQEIEKKVPGLEWSLRTAADTASQHNEIVDSLHEDVSQKIGYVSLFHLFSGKRTLARLFVIVVLLFAFPFVKSSSFTVDTLIGDDEGNQGVFQDLTGMFTFDDAVEPSVEGDRDIFGEETDIEEGSKKYEMELNPEENLANLDDLKNEESKEFKGEAFTGEVTGGLDSSFSEQIDSDDEAIISSFFDNLNE